MRRRWCGFRRLLGRTRRTAGILSTLGGVAATVGCLLCPGAASAQQAFTPSSTYLQAGTAHGTDTLTGGAAWDWGHQWALGPGRLSGYLEMWISQWRYERERGLGTGHLTQVGLTPVLHYRLGADSPWFVEGGVGLSFSSALYQTQGKEFSTRLNFGTHLGGGRTFGSRREHEVAVRIEHFSNAGVKHPNPGENFIQLRYAYRFK
ncbi:MAG: acyloxyacyl hydrolase [Variovorax sp.]|nr:MAG: acyloxyacyl hydrolase [Variovorax sp.]